MHQIKWNIFTVLTPSTTVDIMPSASFSFLATTKKRTTQPTGYEYGRTRRNRKSIKYFVVEIEINVDFATNIRQDEIDD